MLLGDKKEIKMKLLERKKNLNLTDGPLFPSIIAFAIPLILTNIFSVLYHSADMAVLAAFAKGNDISRAKK